MRLGMVLLDSEFEADQGLLHEVDAFLGVKKLSGSPILQSCQRRGQPMCRFLLAAEHGNRVGDQTDQTSYQSLYRHSPILL